MGDKIKKYLYKVVELLVKDTRIDYNRKKIWYPFMAEHINPYDFSSATKYGLDTPTPFYDYIYNTYYLSGDEIDYVWRKYISILEDKFKEGDIISESEDKQKIYLDKVVNSLVKETRFVGQVGFNPPYQGTSSNFVPIYKHTFGLSTTDTFYSGLESHRIYFDHYVKNIYALSDNELNYVWEQYMLKLNNIGEFV